MHHHRPTVKHTCTISSRTSFKTGYKAAHDHSSSRLFLSGASPFAFTQAACLPAEPGKTNRRQRSRCCAKLRTATQGFARRTLICISGYKHTNFSGWQKLFIWCNWVGSGLLIIFYLLLLCNIMGSTVTAAQAECF